MPVTGPDSPDINVVNSAYQYVRDYLANTHNIQRGTGIVVGFSGYIRTEEERAKRNKALYDAIYNLFELEQWESF